MTQVSKSPAVALLDRPIPPEVAAQLLGVDRALFDGQGKLTLRIAFRLALRPALEARHASRGARRAVMRRDMTAAKAEAQAVSATALALALAVTARQIEGDVTEVADRLAAMDPKAAAKLRKAAQAASRAARP
ncbi:hypothetical protein ACEN2J_14495 [Pseudorhodobacter sp. W20_MBD10_FR17]|uniref:hypothetical protein n=1 Tax=Pseudorhodobacter sp. W20_MBD10_FR17 TaxID=3240266 RepID=UPI003F989836